MMFRIGVLSDTHNFLDPRIPELFAGVDHILHAGDIGQPGLLVELEPIAPVTAVGGNTDDPGFRFKQVAELEIGGRRFLVQHIVNPHAPGHVLLERLARARPQAVVFGHTHRPFCATLDGTLFFNPGYAGKGRFGLARSVAILHGEENRLRPEYLPL